jgi:hypothetical protein
LPAKWLGGICSIFCEPSIPTQRKADRHARDDAAEKLSVDFSHAEFGANCHPKNLVQVGIGGWYGNRPGTAVAKRRGTSVLTMQDIEKHGAKKAAEIALDMAWEGCKAVYLSFDPASRRELDRPSLAGSCHARLCR